MLKRALMLSSIVAALMVGILIGTGLPRGSFAKEALHGMDKMVFGTALATEGEGEGECQGNFDSLTVNPGPTTLIGNVSIGAGGEGDSLVEVTSGSLTNVSGSAVSLYDQGYLNVYGDPDTPNYGTISACAGINEGDTTNYFMGIESSGEVMAAGSSGAVAAGDYTSGGQSYTGAYLAALETDSSGNATITAAAHVNNDANSNSGEASLAAMNGSGSVSKVQIDTGGNIIIQLGSAGSQNLLAMQAMSGQTAQSAAQTAAPASNDGVGLQMPQPDFDYLQNVAAQQNGGNLPPAFVNSPYYNTLANFAAQRASAQAAQRVSLGGVR